MPIYQYDCAACDRRVELFFRSVKAAADPACPECSSSDLKRVISRVARVRSSAQRLADIDINQELGRLDGKSEGDFSRWARRMGEQYDDELGSDFGELADRADAGDDPVERADPVHTLRHRVERAQEQSGDTADDA
jgi:putative FmdB family regulatory protein